MSAQAIAPSAFGTNPYALARNNFELGTELKRFNNPDPIYVVLATVSVLVIVLFIYYIFMRVNVTGRWVSQPDKEVYYIWHDSETGKLKLLQLSDSSVRSGTINVSTGTLAVEPLCGSVEDGQFGLLVGDTITWADHSAQGMRLATDTTSAKAQTSAQPIRVWHKVQC